MWLLDRVKNKIKLIYQSFFAKKNAEILNTFPDTFFTLNGLVLRYHDETVKIDHLIIGPCGIYSIQEVNYPGQLSGDETTWTHEYEGKTTNIRSPFEIVAKYAETLRYIIKQNEKYLFAEPEKADALPIYPLIINTAQSGRMNIKRNPVPVIKSFVLKRLMNMNSREEILSSDECLKLGKLLSSKNIKKSVEKSEIDYR